MDLMRLSIIFEVVFLHVSYSSFRDGTAFSEDPRNTSTKSGMVVSFKDAEQKMVGRKCTIRATLISTSSTFQALSERV